MGRRRIGQEAFAFAAAGRRPGSSLDELSGLIDWTPIEEHLAVISCAAKGESAWPPLVLFKATLLSVWYDLSDVKLAKHWTIGLPFDVSAGFPLRSQHPNAQPLFVSARPLSFTSWTAHCSRRSPASSRPRRSGSSLAPWSMPRSLHRPARRMARRIGSSTKGKPAVHGFKAHVGADVDTALVEEIAITPANINDGRAGPAALPNNPGEVFADSAYRGSYFGDVVRAKGGTPRIVATGMWGATKLKRWRASTPGTNRSVGYEAGSKRSLAPGSEATVCGECGGGGWPKQQLRFGSPPSPTISNVA